MSEILAKGVEPLGSSVLESGLGMSVGTLLLCAVFYIVLIGLYLFVKRKQVGVVHQSSDLQVTANLFLNRKERILEVATSAGPVLVVLSENGVAAVHLSQSESQQGTAAFCEVLEQTRLEQKRLEQTRELAA